MKASVLLGVADTLLAQSLSHLLAADHRVIVPQRSGQLLREVEKEQPDVLLLDDSLDEDPASLCLALKRRQPTCRLLFLSTNWQQSLEAQLQSHGVDKVLHKPFATSKLLNTIKLLTERTPC